MSCTFGQRIYDIHISSRSTFEAKQAHNQHAWSAFLRFENKGGETLVGHLCSDFLEKVVFVFNHHIKYFRF